MKKLLIGLAAALVVVGSVLADTATVTLTMTNGQAATYSDPIPASGWLDRIELVGETASSSTVSVATFSGTTALQTFASVATLQGSQVVRPRFQPTAATGTVIPAVVTSGTDTTTNLVTTGLSVNYERAMIGGNTKLYVSSTTNDGSCPITCIVYFEPLKK